VKTIKILIVESFVEQIVQILHDPSCHRFDTIQQCDIHSHTPTDGRRGAFAIAKTGLLYSKLWWRPVKK